MPHSLRFRIMRIVLRCHIQYNGEVESGIAHQTGRVKVQAGVRSSVWVADSRYGNYAGSRENARRGPDAKECRSSGGPTLIWLSDKSGMESTDKNHVTTSSISPDGKGAPSGAQANSTTTAAAHRIAPLFESSKDVR